LGERSDAQPARKIADKKRNNAVVVATHKGSANEIWKELFRLSRLRYCRSHSGVLARPLEFDLVINDGTEVGEVMDIAAKLMDHGVAQTHLQSL
jgi:hypothetical protein